jgi:hypothetical protein
MKLNQIFCLSIIRKKIKYEFNLYRLLYSVYYIIKFIIIARITFYLDYMNILKYIICHIFTIKKIFMNKKIIFII